MSTRDTNLQTLTLTPAQFAAAFPFHLIFDDAGRIQQLGPSLARIRPDVVIGDAFDQHFEIERPRIQRLSMATFARHAKGVFIVRSLDQRLRLRGQMQCQATSEHIFFLGSPWVTDLSQLRALGLTMRDFAVHDPITDMLALLQVKDGALADAKKLAERLNTKSLRLREAKAAAERANRAKSQFIATVSHEIRTSLNALLGLSELLVRTPLSDEQSEYSTTIHTAGQSLLHVVNDVLDLSKIEADKLELAIAALDVRDIVQSVVRLFGESANRKRVSLSGTIAPDVPTALIGDPVRLQQILSNLVGNALKFTHHGSVTIRVTSEATEVDGEHRIRFEVADTGIGIPEDARDRLFDPFTQIDHSKDSTQRYGGTGLGLAICRRLSELMGGAIGVASEPDAGSTFWFTICARENRGEVAGPVATTSFELDRLPRFIGRVLVADDNPINRLVARRMVETLGLEADVAENGEAALDACLAQEYDLVLMDLHMPDLTGVQVTTRVRAESLERQPVIIVSTADVMIDTEALTAEHGMNGFLSKPISIQSMASIFSKWLEMATYP